MKLSDEQVLRWAWESKLGTALTHSPETDQRLYIEGADWHDEISTALTLAYAAGARDMQDRCAKVCEEVEKQMQYGKRTKLGDLAAFTAGVLSESIRALGDDDD